MAGFQRTSGRDSDSKNVTIAAGTAYVVGDLIMRKTTTGVCEAATSSVTPNLLEPGGIVNKAASTTDTEVQLVNVDYNTVYSVESANNSNSAHRYMDMTLTDLNTVNNTGTDNVTNPACYQVGEVGAASDKTLLVKFVRAIS